MKRYQTSTPTVRVMTRTQKVDAIVDEYRAQGYSNVQTNMLDYDATELEITGTTRFHISFTAPDGRRRTETAKVTIVESVTA